jgi:hypothetical protein
MEVQTKAKIAYSIYHLGERVGAYTNNVHGHSLKVSIYTHCGIQEYLINELKKILPDYKIVDWSNYIEVKSFTKGGVINQFPTEINEIVTLFNDYFNHQDKAPNTCNYYCVPGQRLGDKGELVIKSISSDSTYEYEAIYV